MHRLNKYSYQISAFFMVSLLLIGSVELSAPRVSEPVSSTVSHLDSSKSTTFNSETHSSGSLIVRLKVAIPKGSGPVEISLGSEPAPKNPFNYSRWPFIKVETDLGLSPPQILTSFGVSTEVFGGRPLQVARPFDPLRTQTIVDVAVTRGRQLSITVNGTTYFDYRFDQNVLPRTPSLLELESETSHDSAVSATASMSVLRSPDLRRTLSFALLLLSYFLVGFFFIKNAGRSATTDPASSEIKFFTSLLVIFSCAGFVASFVGFYLFPHRDFLYFDPYGWTVSWLVRFSDIYELASIAHSTAPYQSLNSNYPPAMLALLRGVPIHLQPRYIYFFAFVLLVATSLLFKGRSWWVGLAIASSYPFWFAFDRGSTDLLLLFLLAIFLVFFQKRHFRSAALVLGVVISLKVVPVILVGLFFRRRLWRHVSLVSLSAALNSILASVLLPERGLSELPRFVSILLRQSDLATKNPSLYHRNLSLNSQLAHVDLFFSLSKGQILVTLFGWFILSFVVVSIFLGIVFNHDVLKSFLILNISAIVLLDISFEYRLLYLLPAVLMLILEARPSPIDRLLTILFAALFSFHAVFIDKATGYSAGTMISFLLLLITLCLLDFSCIKEKMSLSAKSQTNGGSVEAST